MTTVDCPTVEVVVGVELNDELRARGLYSAVSVTNGCCSVVVSTADRWQSETLKKMTIRRIGCELMVDFNSLSSGLCAYDGTVKFDPNVDFWEELLTLALKHVGRSDV